MVSAPLAAHTKACSAHRARPSARPRHTCPTPAAAERGLPPLLTGKRTGTPPGVRSGAAPPPEPVGRVPTGRRQGDGGVTRAPCSEQSGGSGGCQETASGRAAKGWLQAADAGRQDAPSWPALARSLAADSRRMLGSGPHPCPVPAQDRAAGQGASSLLGTLCP